MKADNVKLPKDPLVWEAASVQEGEMSLEFYRVTKDRASGRCLTQHGDSETANRRSDAILLHVALQIECRQLVSSSSAGQLYSSCYERGITLFCAKGCRKIECLFVCLYNYALQP